MKYDILVQTSLVRIFPKKLPFLAKKLEEKKLSKSVSGFYKTKKKEKKGAWTTKPLVSEG